MASEEPSATSRPWRAYGLVFALALLARLAHLWALAGSPLLEVPAGDAAAYDAWARRLAAGEGSEGPYAQAPLYAWLLGLAYRAGFGQAGARALQALLGALACLLLAEAGRRALGRRAGLLAGFGLALYAPVIHYESLQQRTGLALFLLVALACAMARGGRVSPARGLLLGLLAGAAALARENLIVLAPLVLFYGWRRAGAPGRARLAAPAAALFGLALALAPALAQNLATGGGLALSTNLGLNLYLGNRPGADGLYAPLSAGGGRLAQELGDARRQAEAASGRALAPREVSDFWRGRAFDAIASEPARVAALALRKLRLLAHDHEWTDSQSYVVHRAASPPLAILGGPFRWGSLLPLALAGAVLAWRERGARWIHGTLVLLALSILAVFVFGRLRVVLVPPALLLAGHVLAAAPRSEARTLAAAAAAALAGLAAAFAPDPWIRSALAGEHGHGVTWSAIGAALEDRGEGSAATDAYARAVRGDPDFAVARHNLGLALAHAGRLEEGLAELARAAELEPELAVAARLSAAELLLERGEAGRARSLLPSLEASAGAGAASLHRLGLAWRRLGEPAAAEAAYRAALALDPRLAGARNDLGFLLRLLARWEEAAAELEQAVALAPGEVRARINLGWLRAAAPEDAVRDAGAARAQVEALTGLLGPDDPDVLDLEAAVLAAQGRFREAGEVAERARSAALARGEPDWAQAIARRAEAYRAGQPARLPETGG